MATRRGWDGPLVRRVFNLALDGWSAAEIERELNRLVESGSLVLDRVPTLRTVERWVKDVRPNHSSGRWRLDVSDGEDAAFLLAVRVAVMDVTDGRVRDLSVASVAWLRVILAVAPDLEPTAAYRLARLYQSRVERKQDTGNLDAWLAFGPWRSPQAAAAYERAVERGWIEGSPVTLNWASKVVLAASVVASSGGQTSLGSVTWTEVLGEAPDTEESAGEPS
jgi:hypothetical protein